MDNLGGIQINTYHVPYYYEILQCHQRNYSSWYDDWSMALNILGEHIYPMAMFSHEGKCHFFWESQFE